MDHVVQSWADEFKALFQQQDADFRQAACVVAWRSSSSIQVWSRALEIENTVSAGELTADVVAAKAAYEVSLSPARLLTDHAEIIRRTDAGTVPRHAGKLALWDAWFSLVRVGSFVSSL